MQKKLLNHVKINPNLLQSGGLAVLTFFIIVRSLSLISNSYYVKSNTAKRFGFGEADGMKKTVDYFLDHRLKGPIFNNFDSGSYLIYRLYPQEKVFIDGRPEAYPAVFFQNEYIPMQEDIAKWKVMEKKYGFQTVIFSHTDQTPWGRNFIKRIIKDNDWQLIFFDQTGLILGKVKFDFGSTNQQNLDFLKTQGSEMIKKAYDPGNLRKLGNFFNLIGLSDLEQSVLLKLRQIKGS